MNVCKKMLCALLAVILLAGSVSAFAAGNARLPVGLNGASGKWSAFDTSVYTLVTDYDHVTAEGFTWPSSGAVLVREAASNTTYLITRYKGVTIPAGLIVDFYRYSEISDTYAMQAHFDTTDGKAYTIGTDTTNVGASSTPDTKLATVTRTFTPNTPLETYSYSYTDVDPAAWYYDAVMTTSEGGMFRGYGDSKFGPEDPLTRAQTQIIKKRLLGNSYESYTDTATASRAFAAILLGEATIYGGTVYLNMYEQSLLLRESDYVPGLLFQVKTFDANKGDYVNGVVPGYNPDFAQAVMQKSAHDNWVASINSKNVTYRYSLDEFPDGAAIRQWIRENVQVMRDALILPNSTDDQVASSCEYYFLRAWNLGMFGGVDSAGTFDPYGPLTRAQLCQVLYNMGWTYYGCLDYNSMISAGYYKRP